MSRSLICGLAVVLSFAVASFADAGFGHHRRQADPGCAAPEGVGCSQFEPGCAIEPSCGLEPDCGAELGELGLDRRIGDRLVGRA